MSQDDVITKKSSDSAFCSMYEVSRRNRCQGKICANDDNRPNVKSGTQVTDKVRNTAFVGGAFWELQAFAADRRLPQFVAQADLEQHIRNVYGFKVGVGETGVMGVWVTNKPAGALYEFNFAVDSEIAQHQRESHESGEAARDQFLENIERGGRPNFTDVVHGKSEAPTMIMSNALPLLPSVPQVQNLGQAGAACLAALGSAPMPIPQAPGAASVVTHTPPPEACATPSGVASTQQWGGRASHVDIKASDSISQVGSTTEAAAEEKTRRRYPPLPAGSEGILEFARRGRDEAAVDCSPSNLWNKKVRSRLYENTLTKLGARAAKAAAVLDLPEAAMLAEELYEKSAYIQELQDYFTGLHDDPALHINNEDTAEQMLSWIAAFDVQLKINMFTKISLSLIAKSSIESVATVVKFAKVKGRRLGLGLFAECGPLCDPSVEALDAVSASQSNIVQSFTDKVLKRMSPAEFITVMTKVEDEDEDANTNKFRTHFNEFGWNAVCNADLRALRVFANVLDAVHIKQGQLPASVKREAVDVFRDKAAMSNRLQTACRVNSGTQYNNGKLAWEKISSINDSLAATISPSTINALKHKNDVMSEITPELVDVCSEEQLVKMCINAFGVTSASQSLQIIVQTWQASPSSTKR